MRYRIRPKQRLAMAKEGKPMRHHLLSFADGEGGIATIMPETDKTTCSPRRASNNIVIATGTPLRPIVLRAPPACPTAPNSRSPPLPAHHWNSFKVAEQAPDPPGHHVCHDGNPLASRRVQPVQAVLRASMLAAGDHPRRQKKVPTIRWKAVAASDTGRRWPAARI